MGEKEKGRPEAAFQIIIVSAGRLSPRPWLIPDH